MPSPTFSPRPARRAFAGLAWLLTAALSLAALSAPGYASTANGIAPGASQAGASAAYAPGKNTKNTKDTKGTKGKKAKHRSCKAKKKHRTEIVTAKRGVKAGKRAGRKAFRKCTRAKRATMAEKAGAVIGENRTTDACLASVPDPRTTAPVQICYSLFQPKGSGTGNRVPLIMHSHGWGGSRTTDPAVFAPFLDAGYGVLSFDQRGFGASGGQAYVENPDVEGYDVRALIDRVSGLDWVMKDNPGDPRLGAIGGSYGGGYQFLAAFESLRLRGEPIFDALAPEITWHDLQESLAPDKVVRATWTAALTAAAQPSNAMPLELMLGLAQGTATNMFPDALVPFFEKNGPKHHVAQGRRLDVPVLLGQGTTDSLFPLEQGLQNFQSAITPAARAESIFVGYNGGHVLPAVLPMGVDVTSDPCSAKLAGGTFTDLTLRFFDEQLRGRSTGLTGYGRYHLATPSSTCVTVDSVAATSATSIATVLSPVAGGAPISTEILTGPVTVAGTPHLTGSLTSVGVDNRTFVGLAMGTSPLDATLVQNNVLPINEPVPVVGVQRRIALPSVAVEVPAGQNLYLLTSPQDTIFVGMGSRTPGAITIADAVVHLPVVQR